MTQSGFVILTVTVAMVLIAAIALMLTTESVMEADLTIRAAEALEADYLAQAALQHALWQNDHNACGGGFDVPSTSLGAHTYSVSVDSAATATSYTVNAGRDAWIKEQAPDANFGSVTELPVKNNAGDSHRALYHFGLSSIPAGSRVQSATAWFYVTVEDAVDAVEIHALTTAWTEAAVTWNSIGTSFDLAVWGRIPSQQNPGVWVSISMTGLAQQWVNDPAANHGIMLIATSDGLESKYSSREYGGSLNPYLEVTASFGAVSPVQITATGTLASGVSRMLTRVDEPAYQTPAIIVFQPGIAGADAYTWDGGHSHKNFGASTVLSVNNVSAERTTLIGFDLANLLWRDVRVASAALGLYLEGGMGMGMGTGNAVVDIHRVSRAWVEGDFDDAVPPAGGGVTYESVDGQSNWTNPGGDYDPAPLDTVTIPATTPGWYDWDVTDAVQAWLGGASLHGFLLRASGGDANQLEFTSGDSPTTGQHPRLTVALACECGVVCAAPYGVGAILLVVANASNMTPVDQALRTTFESWGYTVTAISDHANESAFISQGAAHDVVYVSETAVSDTVGMKLTNLSIGVVNEEGNLNDELGIASGRASPVGTSVEIVDTSHYITLPFAAGALEIFSAEMEGLTVSGSQAPGLQTLADWGGAGSLVVLDKGMPTTNGPTAAGRRVMLPLGRSSIPNFNWDYLNNNGRLIVQRALQWGADSPAPGTSYRDEFNARTYSGNDGTLAWSTDWLEIGESDGPLVGDERVESDLGNNFTLRLRDNDNGGEGVMREADLSSCSTATLVFDYRRRSFENSADYVTVEVSPDGGGAWVELDRLRGPANDAAYLVAGYDISAFMAADSRIRFLTSPTLGAFDELYIDNVEIACP